MARRRNCEAISIDLLARNRLFVPVMFAVFYAYTCVVIWREWVKAKAILRPWWRTAPQFGFDDAFGAYRLRGRINF